MSELLPHSPANATFTRENGIWTVTVPQAAWLETTSKQFGVEQSAVVAALVTHVNRQPPGTKKYIFLVVRCQNCGAGGQKGGFKTTLRLDLADEKILWIERVQERCKHKSVDKTLRIILDYYIGKCREEPALLSSELLMRDEIATLKRARLRGKALEEGIRLYRRAGCLDEDEGCAASTATEGVSSSCSPPNDIQAVENLEAALVQLNIACVEDEGIVGEKCEVERETVESCALNECTGPVARPSSTPFGQAAGENSRLDHYARAHRYRGLVLANLFLRDEVEETVAVSRRRRDEEAIEAFSFAISQHGCRHISTILGLAAARIRVGDRNGSLTAYRSAVYGRFPPNVDDEDASSAAIRARVLATPIHSTERREAARALVAYGRALLGHELEKVWATAACIADSQDGCSVNTPVEVSHSSPGALRESSHMENCCSNFYDESDNDGFYDAVDAPSGIKHESLAVLERELREARVVFSAALSVLPKHVAARHGLGAVYFAMNRLGMMSEDTDYLVCGRQEWLAAISAHDDDISRIRGQIISFQPPPDPPLVAKMRETLKVERVLAPPKPAAPRAPVWGSMKAIRRWKEEQIAMAEAAAMEAKNCGSIGDETNS